MKVFCLTLLLISTPALAVSYEEATNIEMECDALASISQSAFEINETIPGMRFENISSMTLDEFNNLTEETNAAMEAGYKAPSGDYAYKIAWAKCMDKRNVTTKCKAKLKK